MSKLERQDDDESVISEQDTNEPLPVVANIKKPVGRPKKLTETVREAKEIDVFQGKDINEFIAPRGRPKQRTEAQKAATERMRIKLAEKRQLAKELREEAEALKKEQSKYVKSYIKKKLLQSEFNKVIPTLDELSIAESDMTPVVKQRQKRKKVVKKKQQAYVSSSDSSSDESEVSDLSDDYTEYSEQKPSYTRRKPQSKNTVPPMQFTFH